MSKLQELVKKYGNTLDKNEWFSLDPEDRELFDQSETGQSYLEYYDRFHGEPFVFNIGMPLEAYDKVQELGGVADLYRECIRQGKTWEELIGWDGDGDEIPIPEDNE